MKTNFSGQFNLYDRDGGKLLLSPPSQEQEVDDARQKESLPTKLVCQQANLAARFQATRFNKLSSGGTEKKSVYCGYRSFVQEYCLWSVSAKQHNTSDATTKQTQPRKSAFRSSSGWSFSFISIWALWQANNGKQRSAFVFLAISLMIGRRRRPPSVAS